MSNFQVSQVRGLLLEEALAALLNRVGFDIVTECADDPTLVEVSAGIAVCGRGAEHQIDVIADFRFTPPFSNQPRLLVEAKYYERKPLGIDIVRNQSGVLRDVSEWFVPVGAGPHRGRYHYQAALFSVSPFSKPAQRYAFAHDIVLVPLTENRNFRPIIEAIRGFASVEDEDRELTLTDIRGVARARLLGQADGEPPPHSTDKLERVIDETRKAVDHIGQAYLVRTRDGFPLFLVPESPVDYNQWQQLEAYPMRIHYETDRGWWIDADMPGGEVRFTFDVPIEFFQLFKAEDRLDLATALRVKREQFDKINGFRQVNGRVETITLRLDEAWATAVERRLRQQG